MIQLQARLLGPPKVVCNHLEVSFPLRKSAALFYYLLIQRQVSRDVAAALLWPEADETTAKKNLRNTLYTIQKALGAGLIVRAGRSELALRGDLDLELDTDRLTATEPGCLKAVYQGEFLRGFSCPELEELEDWLAAQRQHYKKIFIERQKAVVAEHLNQGRPERALAEAEELLVFDELDEELYELIIRIAAKMNRRAKCVEAYQRLTAMLKKEYSLTPSKDISDFIDRLSRNNEEEPPEQPSAKVLPGFFGRQAHLAEMIETAVNFSRGRPAVSLAVLGEAGIGKTNLVRKFVSAWTSPEVEILASNCYQAEEKFPLRPWNQIFLDCLPLLEEEKICLPPRWVDIISQLFPGFVPGGAGPDLPETANPQGLYSLAVEETMIGVLRRIAETKKLLIILEDIHWIDEASLMLLKKLLLTDRHRAILVMVTSRLEKTHSSRKYIADLTARHLIKMMKLRRLNEPEVGEFASLALPGELLTPEFKARLYRETEGNLFFLVEFIKSLQNKSALEKFTPGMRNVLGSRLLNLSPGSRSLLNLLSISFDKVALEDLRALSGLSDERTADQLDELYDHGLVEEQSDHDGWQLSFTHQKLRQYVYEQMPFSRRRVLHARYARLLEERIKGRVSDNQLYPRLIYHFSEMGDLLSLLKYCLKNIGEYFHFNHEVFPVLGDMALTRGRFLYSNQQEAVSQLLAVEDLVRRLES